MVNLILPLLLGVGGGAWLAIRAARLRVLSGNSARVAAILTAVAAPVAFAALAAILNIVIDLASPLQASVAALVSGVVGAAWLVAAAMGARTPDRFAWLALVVFAGLALMATTATRAFDPAVRVFVTMLPILGFLAVAPVAAGRAFEEGRDQRVRWAAYGVGAIMALAAVGALPVALFGIAMPPQEAVHTWELRLVPLAEGEYTLRLDMLDDDSGISAKRLKDHLADGLARAGADAHWENGTLVVQASGIVRASASIAFFGAVGDREGFPTVRENVTATVVGPTVMARWIIEHSGGEGHTCWQRGALGGQVEADGPIELRPEAGDEPHHVCA